MTTKDWVPYIGQKVVCVKSGVSETGLRTIKDRVYTVESIDTCKCGCVNITVVELPPSGRANAAECARCHRRINPVKCYISSSFFAPIPEKYADATAEILEKFKPFEGVETDQPIKIKELETQN